MTQNAQLAVAQLQSLLDRTPINQSTAERASPNDQPFLPRVQVETSISIQSKPGHVAGNRRKNEPIHSLSLAKKTLT